MSNTNVGLIGLGTMGAMLSLNIAEKGFKIAVYNRTTQVTRDFASNAGELARNIVPCESVEELVAAIKPPRAVVLMLPAGRIVDQQIGNLSKQLESSDLIVDAGNANFHDTNRRSKEARACGVPFMGVGVSGGEEGARHGPAIMAGGPESAWSRMRPILRAIAARYKGIPCAMRMGPGGAGHFVKAVHNGIEYADMQIIAESYGILRDGLSLEAKRCGEIFADWNTRLLKSYLVEISAKVAADFDPETGNAMLDMIEDKAGQKGTGRWTVIEAQHLGTPITVIDAAVAARNMSALKPLRIAGEARFESAPRPVSREDVGIEDLEGALIAGKIICYAQGFDLLRSAGPEFGWSLPIPSIAEVWREGCIIRSAMLNDMASALREDEGTNLMFATYFSGLLSAHVPALRRVVSQAFAAGHPVPALAAALSYFDTMRTSRSTANLIQGQRDFFGAHGFERVDRGGSGFHGPWGSKA